MKFVATAGAVEAVKAELRQALPQVKSSHRVEALARGLGWATNAAMRAALADGGAERAVDPAAFGGYLQDRGLGARDQALPDAALRVQIRAVMTARGELTHHGFGIYRRGPLSPAETRAQYAEQREQMLGDPALGEFERACEFLAGLGRTSAPTRVFHSYNLKHSAERWHRHRGIEGRWDREYVSNGMLLAAAFHLGFLVKRCSPDAFAGNLNVSTASVRALDDLRKPPLPQPGAGEPFLVLGTTPARGKHPRHCYVRAGDTRVTVLRPDDHTPRNLLRLAPADYWVSRFPPADRKSAFDRWAAVGDLFGRAFKAGVVEPDSYSRSRPAG